ncbi:MAG: hypothetical protein ABEJ28_00785 [Salinigranum sp.]
MTRKCRTPIRTTRRRLLDAAGGLLVGGATASVVAGVSSPGGSFALTQADRCLSITPLAGDAPIEEFYGSGLDVRNYSATGAGTRALERPETSLLFLYDGPKGLSLVFVHDKYGDHSSGGAVSFDITGLPPDGEWVVQDDKYDGKTNWDQWSRDGSESRVDWTWRGGRTDGGAFRGLGDDPDLAVTIDPAFNEKAALFGQHYDGHVTDWQVLSGDLESPERRSLGMDEPVTIARGSCED